MIPYSILLSSQNREGVACFLKSRFTGRKRPPKQQTEWSPVMISRKFKLLSDLPVWRAIRVFRVVTLHPLHGKIAKVEEINRTIYRRKVRTVTIAR